MELSFRVAGEREIPLIQALAGQIWRAYYPSIITHEQIDYMLATLYSAERLSDELRNQGYLYVLAQLDGTPVGFMGYRHEPESASVKLSKLYLLPEQHGQGIGRRMLEYVRDQGLALGASTLYLFVNKHNARAQRAYDRFGFVRGEGVVTDIGGGFVMDDYRMLLDLRPATPGA